jgi:hypothetical protein
LEVVKRYNNPKDRGELRQILGDLESFFVRRAICELSTKNYNLFFVDMIKALHAANDFSAAAIRGHLTAQTGDSNRWPDDEEFKVCWMMVKFYRRLKKAKARMVLEAIETSMYTGKTEKVQIEKMLTIEHLMPIWGEGEEELESLANTDDISRMVVFDTWLLNCDRYPPDLTTRNPNPDNVFLADTDNVDLMKLIVSDHTHCFTCGRDLTDRTAEIYRVQDDRIYGLFPAFARFLQADIINDFCEVIRSVTRPDVEEVIGLIPTEWEVPSVARHAMADLILRRASFIADNVAGWLFP